MSSLISLNQIRYLLVLYSESQAFIAASKQKVPNKLKIQCINVVFLFLGPLGGVKNMRVTNPTMTSLNVDWDPADGAVRLYKIFYVPTAGGREEMVRLFNTCHTSQNKNKPAPLRGNQAFCGTIEQAANQQKTNTKNIQFY